MPSSVVPALVYYATWYDIFAGIDPYAWASMGVALAVGLSTLGAAWGIFLVGSTLVGAAIKSPHIRSKNLITIIFCEAGAIYGVIVGIIMSSKLSPPDDPSAVYSVTAMAAGYALFAAGFTCGVTNLAGGIAVGVIGSACALADAQNSRLFVTILVIAIFGSALSLMGVIVAVIMLNSADFPH